MKSVRIPGLTCLVLMLTVIFNLKRVTQAEISIPFVEYSVRNLDDKDFILKAYSSGMMKVKLGKAAQIQSDNQRIKDYGIMMDHDYTLANDELKGFAENKNIPVPDKLDDKNEKEVDKLSNKSGTDFDKAYIDMMIEIHPDDIKRFEEASTHVSDAELKKFVKKTLPDLKMHLDSARAIRKSLGAGSRK